MDAPSLVSASVFEYIYIYDVFGILVPDVVFNMPGLVDLLKFSLPQKQNQRNTIDKTKQKTHPNQSYKTLAMKNTRK